MPRLDASRQAWGVRPRMQLARQHDETCRRAFEYTLSGISILVQR